MRNIMHRLTWTCVGLAALVLTGPAVAESDLVRVTDRLLQIGFDPADGTVREFVALPGGDNYLLPRTKPFALWHFTVVDEKGTRSISTERSGKPAIERLAEGLRLVWNTTAPDGQPVRVEVRVRLGQQGTSLSRWELTISKPAALRIKSIAFPRLPGLKPRAQEALAVPAALGLLMNNPRQALLGRDGKGAYLGWSYPAGLSAQCVAFYQPNGPGFYAASDDTLAYSKRFALFADRLHEVHFEAGHDPEQEAAGVAEFRLPYAMLLGTFRGDWSTAARLYRESSAAQTWARRGRLTRGQIPSWVKNTAVWVWNRGRLAGVLPPAAELAKHVKLPVSVFWHWWHDCPYDAGFPEYLPPRDGAAQFSAAVATAHQQGLHVLPYMNQRLWGTTTRSWTAEGAEAFAVKGPDGQVRAEVYNTFLKAPCAPMCMGTAFWRNKYAGMAREVIADLGADGVYMDQACTTTRCFDTRHGHIPGVGRYWTDGFELLTLDIRDRCSQRGPIALAGEGCGEPWLPLLDLMLTLDVSKERHLGDSRWDVIPFFPAIYHTSTICYGSYGSLVYPPYDDRWPAEMAPKQCLTLLDRKFCDQFCLEQARSFVWGLQPMIPNFLPFQLQERRAEIDFLTRLVRTRNQTLKYLQYGTWLRPPALDVPPREIDTVQVGIYTRLRSAKKTVPAVMASAWRAPDGGVAVALASISPEKTALQIPIDATAYGIGHLCAVYRIDDTGRQALGRFDPKQPVLKLDLVSHGGCVLEFVKE
jgi:hypothetical protein